MRKANRGDFLVILILMIITCLLLMWGFKTTAYAIEEIPEEQNIERTHWVDAVELSYEDAQLLMKVSQAEGGTEGPDGQWLIQSVLINRMRSPEWPSTLEGVLKQSGQFATYSNGAYAKAEPTQDSHEALARIEKGDICPNVIGFENIKSSVLDKYFTKVFAYRNHVFYVKKDK